MATMQIMETLIGLGYRHLTDNGRTIAVTISSDNNINFTSPLIVTHRWYRDVLGFCVRNNFF
jgi:hypothetical protein